MELHPSAVYCSPLRRARETVAPYAEAAGLKVTYDKDLSEAHIGGWEGLPFEEIVSSDTELLHLVVNQQPIWHRSPGGETMPEFRDRVVTAIDGILRKHPNGDVVIVAHGGVINAYCGEAVGLPNEMFFLPENTSINSMVVDGERRTVRFLNDVVHLTDPRLFEGP
jgi:alpha-ribazole phosphatase/probable phosphoglycerate mutase